MKSRFDDFDAVMTWRPWTPTPTNRPIVAEISKPKQMDLFDDY